MKSIFTGKKKIIIIPIAIILGLVFAPFAIAGLLLLLVHRKVSNKTIRYSLFVIIGLFTLFFGSAWVIAMSSSSETKKETAKKTVQVDKNTSQATKSVEPTIKSSSVFKAQTTPSNKNIVLAKVVGVVDGDTIEVNLGQGTVKRVRYIGIDTPESVDPRKPIQCFSKEATAKNKQLVENNVVGLEKDVSETDKYGRLLRYVYVGDFFVNQALVADGYANAVSYPPDVKYQEKLKQAELQARAANKGLWGSCNTTTSTPNKNSVTTNPTNTQMNTNTSTGTTKTNSGGTCKYSCSSPDRDCSDFSSHTEAQAFFNCCGFTEQNDPMRLDNVGVGDGVACENI